MKGRQGFTLMELLVVLLIIGILSTVALRTIDATRDRSLFDQTTKEMDQLVKAIVGNPDLTYDGRRVDFGYFGDMEELPNDLRDLVYNPGSTAWHGPYLRLATGINDSSYRFDGWGKEYKYNSSLGEIMSDGNPKFPITVSIADSTAQLYDNVISGTFTDRDNNPPDSAIASRCSIRLYYNNEVLRPEARVKAVNPGGYYQYSPTDTVPIGLHKLVAEIPGESLVRWVTVLPRSRTVVDFRFSKSFLNNLRMSGPPRLGSSPPNAFEIDVVNEGTDSITVRWLQFKQAPSLAFMRDLHIRGSQPPGYPIPDGEPGEGLGDTVFFTPVTIGPDLSDACRFNFGPFYVEESTATTPADLTGAKFVLLFEDRSQIEVQLP